MYIVLGLVMLLRGFADAIMMRAQQAIAFGDAAGYLPPHHYDQIFTAHGVIMIFFVAMPLVTGLMNFVVPLQIGARDVAFPVPEQLQLLDDGLRRRAGDAVAVRRRVRAHRLACLSAAFGNPRAARTSASTITSGRSRWRASAPLLSGVNLIATIVKMRAPGMTMMRMPIFTWTALCTNVLIVAAFPVLTAVLALLSLDRYVGTNFFTNDLGGNPMMYVNLIWIWGHPEVYILILPAFGIFSEVVSTFCGKRLFGYTSMVYATVVITILSYLVWLHHFFTMGSGASVNSFFGITTMIISIPTGAKIFNWLFTMYRGRIRFEVPMMWTVGFMVTFVIGGMTGVLLAVPPADFVLHNSLFLVAHFHNVIIGGVVFGVMAGITYWFPKAFGFRLDPFWGKCSFWFWIIGFYFAFMPLYVLGLMGVTRRLQPLRRSFAADLVPDRRVRRAADPAGHPAFLVQLVVSYPRGASRCATPRRSVERPHAGMVDLVAAAGLQLRLHADRPRQRRLVRHEEARPCPAGAGFVPIHMPKNTGRRLRARRAQHGLGFGLIWHMWLLAGARLRSPSGATIVHTFNYDRESTSRGGRSCAPRTPAPDSGEPCLSTDSHRPRPAPPGADPGGALLRARASPENGTLLGFWLYLMSDCLVFACLFATYGVLGRSYAGGPSGADLFDLPLVAVNTSLLLLSSITYGFAVIRCSESAARDARLAGSHRSAGRRLRRHRAARVRAPDPRGRRPAAQRLPLRRSSRSSARTACT